MIEYPDWLAEEDRFLYREYLRRRARRFATDRGLAIHHIDGNPHNNDLTNLKLVSIKEHSR